MKVQVLGDRENIFKGVVDEAILPAIEGEVSIWDFHQPYLLLLTEGILALISKNIRTGMRLKKEFSIKGGLAIFEGNRLVAICDIKE